MIEGLKLALKHCTKYEDKMYLSFLLRKELAKKDPEIIYGVEDLL